MTSPSIAIIAMGGEGQYQRLRPLLASLRERDLAITVFTDSAFAPDVQRVGGTFVDLFADRPTVTELDEESAPLTIRYVAFAGYYADELARDVAAVRPTVVMSDTYALIGRVVASILNLPHINICHGADVHPARFAAQLTADPRLQVSAICERALDALRQHEGFEDATPMSFLTNQSRLLNIYFEPEQYLSPETREAFAPVAFFGSLPSDQELEGAAHTHGAEMVCGGDDGDDTLNVYVSFGTIVWTVPLDSLFTAAADSLAAARALSSAFAARPEVRGVISFGRANFDDDLFDALRAPNVRVERYVDQWQVLAQADAFVTHSGLNSTHEAVFHEVPMISYPLFWDHPPLAEKSQALGLAIPLTPVLRGPVTEELVHAALDEFANQRDAIRAALARARVWELETVAQRPAVVDRILDLI